MNALDFDGTPLAIGDRVAFVDDDAYLHRGTVAAIMPNGLVTLKTLGGRGIKVAEAEQTLLLDERLPWE